jgi:hypothetical protein
MKNITKVLLLLLSTSAIVLAAQKPRWVSYKSNLLNIEIAVPPEWTPSKIPKALAFHYDDLVSGSAAIGILKSDQITDIEWAAEKQLETEGRPEDWTRSPATVGGFRAVKITGTDAKDSGKRFVHYYIAAPRGVYIVQCMAPAEKWSTYSPTFSTILTKLKFH